MTPEMSGIFRSIEGGEFKAELGLAAGLSAFFELLRESPTVSTLVMSLSTQENREKTLERIRVLAGFQIDPSYRNPQDIPLAAYLWSLWGTDRASAQVAAGMVRSAPNTWWGDLMAQQVLNYARAATPSVASILDGRLVRDDTDTLTTSLFWTPPATITRYVVISRPNRVTVTGRAGEAKAIQGVVPSQGMLNAGESLAFDSVFSRAMLGVDTKTTSTEVGG